MNKTRWRWLGLIMALLGFLILGLILAYLSYVFYTRNQVGHISVEEPLRLPAPDELSDAAVSTEAVQIQHSPYISLYALVQDPPEFWDDPYWLESLEDDALEEQFQPVVPEELLGSAAASPTRLRIPALDLDASIEGLPILNLGDARQYATPKNVVGHIPESANPGARGNVWLFGHLESPIRGEGSIFGKLPQVHDLLRNGQRVYVVVDSDDGSFLYQVREFNKIHQDDLRILNSNDPLLTMVTCWPHFKYDERILVTAELVGMK